MSILLGKCLARHVGVERLRIPCLHVDGPRPGELANQAFPGADSADDASGSDALHDVFAVPRHKMAVVDDVAFTLHKLSAVSLSVFRLDTRRDLHLS